MVPCGRSRQRGHPERLPQPVGPDEDPVAAAHREQARERAEPLGARVDVGGDQGAAERVAEPRAAAPPAGHARCRRVRRAARCCVVPTGRMPTRRPLGSWMPRGASGTHRSDPLRDCRGCRAGRGGRGRRRRRAPLRVARRPRRRSRTRPRAPATVARAAQRSQRPEKVYTRTRAHQPRRAGVDLGRRLGAGGGAARWCGR